MLALLTAALAAAACGWQMLVGFAGFTSGATADALVGGLEALHALGRPPPLMHNRWTTHGTWEAVR